MRYPIFVICIITSWYSVLMPALAVLVALLLQTGERPKESPCDANLGAWLSCNNPRVIRYLSKLSAKHVGTVLAGVELTDGTKVLEGCRFIGRVKGISRGVNVFAFESDRGRIAYAWVEKGATPLPLPKCKGAIPGSAYVLSGDVYTSKALQPGNGVVQVACLDPDWTLETNR